jgi:phage FluMu protein Com
MTIWWFCSSCGKVTDEFESDVNKHDKCPKCRKEENENDFQHE